ncbi:MAG TPA: CpaF family protein [Chloroflexi bacterium]|nr:CpaF family protein [Chloroflexota bacterium]
MTEEQQQQVIEAAVTRLSGLPLTVTRNRAQMQQKARAAVQNVVSEMGFTAPDTLVEYLAQQVAAAVGGFGFLDALLPPNRTDLVEIALNPDGSVWLNRKGEMRMERYDYTPSVQEAWRAVEAILGVTGRALTEATPSVDAKLPRFEGMGGARVKAVHPIIAPGEYPVLSIRLFEPRPVLPEQIIAWETTPPFVMDEILRAVSLRSRVLVIGGTATGKTTFLSAIANGGIPLDARVVKIEDPEEIWLQHPNVVTLEARHPQPGSSVPPYRIADGVDDALRMRPDWLIVGEVRTGRAALALFRAQMSDHPGLSTFHAETPDAAVKRLSLIMFGDAQVRFEPAKGIFEEAVDVVVQVGWHNARRRVLGVWEVAGMKGGNVKFRQLYAIGDEGMGKITRTRTQWDALAPAEVLAEVVEEQAV